MTGQKYRHSGTLPSPPNPFPGVNCSARPFGFELSSPDPISPVESSSAEPTPYTAIASEDPVWNLLDVLAIFAFAIFALIIISVLAVVLAHSLPHFRSAKLIDVAQNPLVAVPAQAIAYILVVAFMVQIVRLRKGNGFLTSVSWNLPGFQKVLVAIGSGAALALSSEIFFKFTSQWVPKSLPIDKYFRDATSAYVLALFGMTFAPLVEELFFRGFLYPALSKRIGIGASVVLTAASFAVLHQGQLAHAWIPLTWLFLVGTVLTLVRARTKSVALCVVMHVGYNATLFTLVFIGTQGFQHLDQV